MAETENRVEFGLKNLYIAPYAYTPGAGGGITIGTPVKIDGAVGFSPDVSSTQTKHHADDIVYFSEITETGHTAELTVTVFPDSFKKSYLGYKMLTDGAIAAVANPEYKPFVLLFQGDGDAAKVRHVYYNCKGGPIKRTHSTVGEQKNIETETIELAIAGTETNNIIHAIYREGGTGYSGLTAAIPVPALPASP